MKKSILFNSLLGCLLLLLFLFSFVKSYSQWVDGGTRISTNAHAHRPIMSLMNDGSVYITWVATYTEGHYGDIYLNAIAADGTVKAGWPQGGIQLTFKDNQWAPVVITSEDQGAIVAWQGETEESTKLKIFIQKYSVAGTPLWNKGKALLITSSDTVNDQYPILFSDKHKGCFVTWTRFNADMDPSSTDVLLQHIDSTGNIAEGYDKDAVIVSNTTDSRAYYPRIIISNDGSSVYVMYFVGGIGKTSLYLKKFNTVDGKQDAGWDKNGLALSLGPLVWPDISKEHFLFMDNLDNVIAFWLESRMTGNGEIFMQRISPSGETKLEQWGKYISGRSATGDGISYVEITKDEQSNFLIVNNNYENSYDLYALKKAPNGNTIWVNKSVSANGTSAYPKVVSDGRKGMYIFYKDITGSPELLKALALDSTGALYDAWPVQGSNFGKINLFPMGMVAMPNLDFVVVPNIKGQAIVCWNRFMNNQFNLYACNLLSDGSNCSDRTGGMNNINARKNNIKIYPNPFNSEIKIDLPEDILNKNSCFVLRIYDITGKSVINKSFHPSISSTINTNYLNKGLFYFNLIKDDLIIDKGILVKE
ncbi:MAG: T9SS type A sorting domain-containing protein [Bacteroidales bacterium]|nr:T9SS type A sorting domain-containing protein [Bacteroidales bacterium]